MQKRLPMKSKQQEDHNEKREREAETEAEAETETERSEGKPIEETPGPKRLIGYEEKEVCSLPSPSITSTYCRRA